MKKAMLKESKNYQWAKCNFCKKDFLVYIYNLRKGFGKHCSKRCSNKKNRLGFKKGHPNFWTKESKEKLSKTLKGHKTTKETREKIGNSNRGKKRSLDIREKLSAIHVARWDRVGRKPRNTNDRYKDSKYLSWRRRVFFRDKFTCQICGQVGGRIEADHIKEWVNYPTLRYELLNGRVLCKECHSKTPNYKSKAKRTQCNEIAEGNLWKP